MENATDTQEIYERYRGLVRGVATSLTASVADADDLEAEGWSAFLGRKGGTAKHPGGLLRTTLRRSASQLRERLSNTNARERAVARPEGSVPSPDEIVEAEEVRAVLVREILALEDRRREAVLARYHLELSEREAADHLGVPLDTFRSRLKSAREILRGRLIARFGGDPRAMHAALAPLCAPVRGGLAGTLVSGGALPILGAAALVVGLGLGLGARELLRVEPNHASPVASNQAAAPSGGEPVAAQEVAAATKGIEAIDPPESTATLARTDAADGARTGLPSGETHGDPAVAAEGAVAWTGIVRDADGRPVEGALVVALSKPNEVEFPLRDDFDAESPDLPWTRTDSAGRFRLEHSEAEPRYLLASGKDLLPVGATRREPGEWTLLVQPTASVTGRIVQPDGAPAPSTSVRFVGLSEGGTRSVSGTTTDSQGRFRLTDLPREGWRSSRSPNGQGTYFVLEKSGFPVTVLEVPLEGLISPLRGGGTQEGPFDLELALAEPRSLTVNVQEAGTDRPLHDAEVFLWSEGPADVVLMDAELVDVVTTLYPRPWAKLRTDEAGRCRFDLLPHVSRFGSPSVQLFVAARTEEHGTRVDRLVLDPAATEDLGLELAVRTRDPWNGLVQGADGEPLAGATVTMTAPMGSALGFDVREVAPMPTIPGCEDRGTSVVTDAQGRFVLTELPKVEQRIEGFDVRVSHETHGELRTSVMISPDFRGSNRLRYSRSPGGSTPKGAPCVVVDEDGHPLVGARLRSVHNPQVFVTDERGRAAPVLYSIGDGIFAEHRDHLSVTVSYAELPEAEAEAGRLLILERGLPGVGRVLDQDGVAVGGAVVRVAGSWTEPNRARTTRTDAEGRFDLGRVPRGEFEILVSPGPAASSAPFEPSRLFMSFANAPEVVVTRTFEEEFGSASVTLVGGPEPLGVRFTDGEGGSWRAPRTGERTFVASALPSRVSDVRVQYRDRTTYVQPVRVRPGVREEFELHPAPGARLTGRVIGPAEIPQPLAIVIQPAEGRRLIAYGAADGTFAYEGLEPGTYRVAVSEGLFDEAWVSPSLQEVTIPPGEDRVELDLIAVPGVILELAIGGIDRSTRVTPKITLESAGEERRNWSRPSGADYTVIQPVPGGGYELTVEAEGYYVHREVLRLPNTGKVEHRIELRSDDGD